MVELRPATELRRPPAEVRSIQYLRGFAAFGVLIYHAAERAGGHFGTGAAGVDVFFVISGFIMWVVTCGKPPSPGQFLIRRVQRIVPLYWGLTLLVVGVALAAPWIFPAMQVTAEAVVKSLFFVPYRDHTGLIAPLVIPGWTLNYEMFFYVLFAFGLMAPVRLRAWLVSAALVALVAIRPLGDVTNPVWATYTNPLLLEFGAGIWLGKAWAEDRLPGVRAGWALVFAGLIGFAVAGFSGIDVERARFLIWGLPALALVAGAVAIERNGTVPRLKPLQALGDASYSLYLVHGLAISAVVRLLDMAGLASPALILAGGLIAGVVAGLITYHLVEKPLMGLFKTGLGSRRTAHRSRPAAPVPPPAPTGNP
ncbi:acyltransferase [Phenylobacterium sp. J367]|uniref:acyltransferase family protein n=1 Tax=Phenylobacterium sp. J367 TaxID=2898435 RepID=UPI002151E0AA|nr:acyltransferase [Phenylobacterium sp. J367]MCR5880886.1 acyltransferase [Phenylobacterium sp. J367]